MPTAAELVTPADRSRLAIAADAALGLVVALAVSVTISAGVGGDRDPDVTAYLFAIGLGALMLVRRPFPVLALLTTAVAIIAYYAAGYPAIGLAVPVAAALYAAAEAGRAGWAVLTAAGLLVVSAVARLGEGDDPAFVLVYELVATVATMAAATALGAGARARRLWRAEQQHRERRLLLDRELETARRIEEARLHLAREVHDVLAHTVSVISLHADVAVEALDDDPDGVRVALGHVRSASEQAMREIRGTVDLLRDPADPRATSPAGGLAQLDHLVRSTVAGGLPVTVRVDGSPEPLPAAVDTTAYRIVQEALTNAIRHAGASHSEVALHYDQRQLAITITDDGRGGDPEGSSGHGIAGMRERVALLGGTLHAGSRGGGGFEVRATLPLEPR